MGVDIPTVEEIEDAFVDRLEQACRAKGGEGKEFDDVFRGLMSAEWQRRSENLTTIAVDHRRLLFRVEHRVAVDKHRASQWREIDAAMRRIAAQVVAIVPDDATAWIAFRFLGPKDTGFGYDVSCGCQGFVERRVRQT
jgi:hypothetical protein